MHQTRSLVVSLIGTFCARRMIKKTFISLRIFLMMTMMLTAANNNLNMVPRLHYKCHQNLNSSAAEKFHFNFLFISKCGEEMSNVVHSQDNMFDKSSCLHFGWHVERQNILETILLKKEMTSLFSPFLSYFFIL